MKKLLISAATVGLMTSAAYAGPTVMTDEKMDSMVAAGTAVVNPGGKQVWFIAHGTTLINNGGNGPCTLPWRAICSGRRR